MKAWVERASVGGRADAVQAARAAGLGLHHQKGARQRARTRRRTQLRRPELHGRRPGTVRARSREGQGAAGAGGAYRDLRSWVRLAHLACAKAGSAAALVHTRYDMAAAQRGAHAREAPAEGREHQATFSQRVAASFSGSKKRRADACQSGGLCGCSATRRNDVKESYISNLQGQLA